MGDRMYCPGCDNSLSSILNAVRNGQPCPNCGLSPGAIVEINNMQDSRAEQELKDKVGTMIIEEEKLRRELAWCKRQLDKLRDVVGRGYDPKAETW